MQDRCLGPFRIEAELGSGGMGTVYRAVAKESVSGLDAGSVVALKIVHPHLLEQPGFFKRFLREASIGRSVRHENVVRTFDCDQLFVDGVPQSFLVIEYVAGQTLRALLDDLGRVPEELCRHVGCEIAKGLVAIHDTGVIHRDLKPENVLITPDHEVKIMDLGVARLKDESIRLSRSGHFVGSLLYAAPEALHADTDAIDGRADLHGLGVLLYELGTGRHPFRHDDVRVVLHRVARETPRRAGEVHPQLSPFFEELVHTLLAKQPAERLPSASHVVEVLEAGEASAWWQERARAIREATRRPLRRIRVPRETALYGRDGALAELTSLYESAVAGEGRVVLIEGEAGIGKTRLVDEFVGRLRAEGEDLNFLFGSYPPGGAATAAGAFATAWREYFGVEGLDGSVRPYLEAAPALVPAFSALLKGEPPPTGEMLLTPDSLPTAFVHTARALARERPTVILVDDLHCAPAEGRALFASLALAIPGDRVLLIGTFRRRVPAEWVAQIERLEHATRLDVDRLGPKDLVRLLEDAFHSKRLAQDLAGRIAVKSDGNPFFAFEIIRGLRERQLIRKEEDGRWVTTGAIDEIHVPSSVVDLVEARVAHLAREERDLLDVASCCGFEFDPLPLADVLQMPRIELLKMLGRIERRHRLVRASGRRFVFDHHQVQEALYGGLSELLREEYHVAIASSIEASRGAADADVDALDGALCVELCEHFFTGRAGPRALRYLARALDHLEGGYVNEQAVALAQQALEMPGLVEGRPRFDLLMRVDGRLDLLGRRDAQRRGLEEAARVARELEDERLVARVERAHGWLDLQTGHSEAARVRLQRALLRTRELEDLPGEGLATGHLGIACRMLGRYDEAMAHHERHLAIAKQLDDPRSEATATGSLGLVLLVRGRYEEARSCFERHQAIARETGNRHGLAKATGNLGLALRALGRYEEARANFERRHGIACEMGDRRGETLATGNLGLVSWDLGRMEEALAFDERHNVLAREIGDRAAEARGTGNLGLVLHALGRFEEALDHHRRHLALARELEDKEGASRAIGNLGLAEYALGRYADAERHHREHLTAAEAIGHAQGLTLAQGNLGLVLLAMGRAREARSHEEEAQRLAASQGDRRSEGVWLQALGEVALQTGDGDEALRCFEQALALCRAMGHESGVVECLARLGVAEAQQGRSKEAAEHLDGAIERADAIGHEAVTVVALAHRAALPGGDGAAAADALARSGARLEHDMRMEVRMVLYGATGSPEHLEAARRLLDVVVENTPPERRDALLHQVPLHSAITEGPTA